MTAPLFTVLIDTYNYGQYVEEAVRSALEQDFPAEQFEVLVVDDGSTDDTAARLEKFAGRIRYLQKPNGGQASAFNWGLETARGEFIALLDADDVWLPSKLRRVADVFSQQPDAGLVYHRMYEWTENGQLSKEGHFVAASGHVAESRFWLLCYPMMQASGLVFRRRAMQDLLPIPEVLRTQADAFLTALIIFICPVAALDEYLAKYRLHDSNLFYRGAGPAVQSKLQQRMNTREALLEEIRTWLRKHGLDAEGGNVRDYLIQWRKAQEADGFALQAPSRWEFFRHLIEYPVVYRELMSPRQLIYSYLRALAGLALGYRHIRLFDAAHTRYKNHRRRKLGSPADHSGTRE
jgi:glycosyltransferase involved in cell wall biosynthesis